MTDPAQPAATLVLLRDAASGPELFMQTRARTMGFAAGMMVFPGGKVDDHDRALAADPSLVAGETVDLDDRAARVAAVRESFEEAGVLLTRGTTLGPELLADAQPRVSGRTLAFGEFLARHGHSIDLDALVPFTRWVPPASVAHRRYDTRFYLARMPADAIAGHDGNEATTSHWITAAGALHLADQGDAQVIFPTRRNLERLAQFGSVEALIAHARETPLVTVQPVIRQFEDGHFLCIPEGIGYPVTREALTSALRG
jgi:8-oxo-dGTP pyrophosphatase MutT (NUDIX family)